MGLPSPKSLRITKGLGGKSAEQESNFGSGQMSYFSLRDTIKHPSKHLEKGEQMHQNNRERISQYEDDLIKAKARRVAHALPSYYLPRTAFCTHTVRMETFNRKCLRMLGSWGPMV